MWLSSHQDLKYKEKEQVRNDGRSYQAEEIMTLREELGRNNMTTGQRMSWEMVCAVWRTVETTGNSPGQR